MSEDENYGAEIEKTALAIMQAISLGGDPEQFTVDRDVALEALAQVAGLIMAPMDSDWQEEIGPWFVGLVRESIEAASLHFSGRPQNSFIVVGP